MIVSDLERTAFLPFQFRGGDRMVARVNPALETLLLPFASGALSPAASALFLGAEPHPELKSWEMVTGWQPLKPLAEAWDRAGFCRVEQPHGHGTWLLVLLLPGKSKEETLALFAKAHDLLAMDGRLVVAMSNTAGAGRFEKELAAVAGGIETASKHKCRVFHTTKTAVWNAEKLAEWRALGERREISGTSFVTEAGIFSAEHVDPGSAFLVEHLPANLKGVVADLGAGWGYLSQQAALKSPGLKSLHLFEADARALGCAQANLKDCAIETFFHWHDVTAGLPGRYEVILMNPPFHSGQNTDIGLGKDFLQVAAASLRVGGRLFIVANRQLPYEAELDRTGLTWRKQAEEGAYKLLFAEKRR